MALNTRESPIVLAFQEGTTREAIHLERHHIITLYEVFSDIELRRYIRILTITYALTVHPKIKAVTDTIEAHIDVVFGEPVGSHIEMATVCTHRIGHTTIVGKPVWAAGHHRIGGLVERERVSNITVEWLIP